MIVYTMGSNPNNPCDPCGVTGDLVISGNFDYIDRIHIQGSTLTLVNGGNGSPEEGTYQGQFPTDITPISITYGGQTYQWKDAHSPFTLPHPVGQLTAATVSNTSEIPPTSGVTIEQQPSSANGYETIVRIDDIAAASYHFFDFGVNWS